MIQEITHISHRQLTERNPTPPITLQDSVNDFSLSSFAGLKLPVNLPQLLQALRRRIRNIVLPIISIVLVARKERSASCLFRASQPFEDQR
jgi:hypothetical protein